jgi:hypothetical protein
MEPVVTVATILMAGLSLEFYLRRGAAVCQALKSIANVQKKPATKRMRVAMSGNGKDF